MKDEKLNHCDCHGWRHQVKTEDGLVDVHSRDWIEKTAKMVAQEAASCQGDEISEDEFLEDVEAGAVRLIRREHAAHCVPLDAAIAERIAKTMVETIEDPEADWDGTVPGIAKFILRVRDGASGKLGKER